MNVRSAREDKGWSQEHLAAASGVSLRTVQRAEAGSRVSPENTLALCAALEIRPSAVPPTPTADAGTLPHLAKLRSALGAALAGSGERLIWQKADASPVLLAALGNMGLPQDADGFAEAERRIRRTKGMLSLSELALFPLVFLWCIGLIVFALHLPHFHKDLAGTWDKLGVALTIWLALTVPLAAALFRMSIVWEKVEPWRITVGADATVVASDLRPVEAALTQGFMWISKGSYGKAQVIRIRLDAIRDVTVSRSADGAHSARFLVEGLPVANDDDVQAFELTRLRDDEAAWLDRRFAGLKKAVVLTPSMA
jgi:transcriptional regulator with XRE-family HTH domain